LDGVPPAVSGGGKKFCSNCLLFVVLPGSAQRINASIAALPAEFRQTQVGDYSRMVTVAILTLYRNRPDKSYSLTDCISMQIMRRQRLTEVLTSDRHFEQEGFRALFRAA